MSDPVSQSLGASGANRHLFLTLLTPSWLSGLIAIVVSLVVVGGTIVILHFPASGLHQLVNDQQGSLRPAVSDGISTINKHFSGNAIIDNAPLFVLWGCVGLAVYFFAANLVNILREANEFRAELTGYAHVNRLKLIGRAFGKLLLRVAVLVAWVLFVQLTVHTIVPYAIALTQYGSGAVGVINNVGAIVLAFVIVTVCLHLHVVLLRLLMLRPRVIGQADIF